MKSLGKPFEVVFVSADHDEKSFKEYYGSMPWLAIPFNDERREGYMGEQRVSGIPDLKIISTKTGKVIEPSARNHPLTVDSFNKWLAGL